jgi:hypothetical protein
MKKFLLSVAMLACILPLALVLTACGKDNDKIVITGDIIGVWVMDGSETEFRADGTWHSYETDGGADDTTGTFTLSGDTVKIYFDGELVQTCTLQFNADKSVMTQTDIESGESMVFTRK